MRKRFLAVLFLGWVLFAPTPWAGVANSQTRLPIPLTVPASTNGTLTLPFTTAPWANPFGWSFNADAFTITLTAGQTYTISLLPSNGTWPNDDSYMFLMVVLVGVR